jgi:hypothetical protein
MYEVADENLSNNAVSCIPDATGICVLKSSEKKFQSSSCPLTLFIETKLTESIESLKNFKAIPGVSGCHPLVRGCHALTVGLAADDNLKIPLSAP